MTTVLQINSSLYSNDGQSSRLADAYVESLRGQQPDLRLIKRDLARDPLPHLDAERFQAFVTPADARDAAQRAVIALSDALIAELRSADIVVLGLPMYNFGVPSTLKAYFDHVARAGETFRYTAEGPVGLLTGKRAVVLAARGGAYAGTPRDTQTPYVRDFLRFLGIATVEVVHAENLAMGADARDASLAQARAAIHNLAAPARRAA